MACCYAILPKVAKLRHLLKPLEPWVWNEETNDVLKQAKEVIAEKVEEGVRFFVLSFKVAKGTFLTPVR